jgi:hypothetical protein
MATGTSTVSEMDSKASEVFSMLLGLLVILGAVYGVFAGGRAIYHRFSPPATVALVADLEKNGDKLALHAEGAVQRSGQPLSGQVQISVQQLWQGSAQTVQVPLVNGQFTLPPNRFTFAKTEASELKLLIAAEAWTKELPNRPASAEVYVNASSLTRYKRVLNGLVIAASLLMAAVFFWAFTGQRSPLKNRVAIVFSYCVMLLFLAIPLTVTNIALSMFSEEFDKMSRAPVGIVLAKPADAKADTQTQWFLNIGGHILREKDQEKTVTASPGQPSGQSATSHEPDATAGSAAPSGTAAPTPAAGPRESASSTASGGARGADKPATSSGAAPADSLNRLEGGIAIPFYVLVLAVIGGAINMARKIPEYHQEGEQSAIEVEMPMFAAMRSMLPGGSGGKDGQKAAPTTAAVAGQPAAAVTLDPAGGGQEHEPVISAGAQQPLDQSKDAVGKKEDWRTGLLHQYMYLISSPFLAIVTYYLLAWLGVSTLPALVLVSFSVGLITEPLMTRITRAAESIVGGEEKDKKEKPEPGEEHAKEDELKKSPAETKAAGAGQSK